MAARIEDSYIIRDRPRHLIVEGRYYNVNAHPVAIVASITEGIDWAAYMGGGDDGESEDATLIAVARWGAKMLEADARHFFSIDLPYRS